MERTLDAGLARLFGGPAAPAVTTTAPAAPGGPETRAAPSAPSAPGAPGAPDLAADAQATYERAIAAQKAGDWARYGEEIRRLGDILRRMKQP